MIGNLDWLGQIVGGAADGDITTNAKIARALIRAGLAVVIIEPGGKKAVCTLNTRDKKAADVAAQDIARQAGSPNWARVRHDCGIKHAITEEKELTRARVKALLASGANLAVAPGAGSRRIIIVDVDTAEERRAFLDDWASHLHGMHFSSAVPMTVSSPGQMATQVNGDEVKVHKDGGHYWFEVPEDVTLPERPGRITWCRCHQGNQPPGGCRNAWAAYYRSGYVLVPPSGRKEGPYRLTGSVHEAPSWLTTLISSARTTSLQEDGREGLSALNANDDPIDVWSARTSWHELLTADGFTPCDHDACGCPTFTRPGDATHSKSVTGHEAGCTKYDTSRGHGPLRIWSDALGAGTMSKLTYTARFHHDGDVGAAMRELGITALSGADELMELGDLGEIGGGESPKDEAPDGATAEDPFAPVDWAGLFAADDTEADHLPGQLLERGQQISIIGDGKSGKSVLILEWCLAVITGKPFLIEDVTTDPLTILYVDGENSRRDLLMRLRSLGADPGVLDKLVYLSFPPFKPMDSDNGARQVTALVDKYNADVVILDTVSRFIEGKENDSDTWLNLYRLLHKRLKARRVSGIRLDHFGKDAEKGGRGSSAKSQDIDHVWELIPGETEEHIDGDGVQVVTYLDLRRTHTRTGTGPDRLRVKRSGRLTGPLRDSWAPGESGHTLADVFDGGRVIDEVVRRPIEMMRKVCELLEGEPEGMPLRAIRRQIIGKNPIKDQAITTLIEEGHVKIEKRGNANLHILIEPLPEGDL